MSLDSANFSVEIITTHLYVADFAILAGDNHDPKFVSIPGPSSLGLA